MGVLKGLGSPVCELHAGRHGERQGCLSRLFLLNFCSRFDNKKSMIDEGVQVNC